MNTQQAQSAVSLSAFVVAVIFAYRKLTEPAVKSTSVPATSHFVIGFGFTFITLSLLAQAAPTFGGMMAILVATGDTLANGVPLVNDLSSGLKRTAATTTASIGTTPPTPVLIAQAAGLPAPTSTLTPNPPAGVTLK